MATEEELTKTSKGGEATGIDTRDIKENGMQAKYLRSGGRAYG